jgi:HAD superfamily hydrolase (TIGR01509 family)
LLSRLKVDSYLEGTIISQDIGYRKPHERIFRAALETLKCGAKDSVMIGDSISEDITGAKAVGMGTVLVLNDRRFSSSDVLPDRTISDLSQLVLK